MYPIAQTIFLLQTGGTIGSTANGNCIDIDTKKGDQLIQAYEKIASHYVTFDVERPFNILSENAVPSHWAQIIDVLKKVDFKKYKGIILTHGSDTLPYTAAALSYFFTSTPIPIVLVCSNHPLGHPKSNALSNFSGAVDFILNAKLPGVFAVYKNSDGKAQIHLGSRLLEADWIYDDFLSFGNKPFARTDHHCLGHGQSKLSPSSEALKNRPLSTHFEDIPTFENNILALRAYPGLNYDYINIKNSPPAAILHSLYHCGSGNATGPEGFSLADFIAHNPEIDHYLISYKNTDTELYATCLTLIKNGGIPLKNISFEAAVTKLFFAYNQNKVAPEDYMKTERFFEFL